MAWHGTAWHSRFWGGGHGAGSPRPACSLACLAWRDTHGAITPRPCHAVPFVACPPRGRWRQPASPPTPPAHLPQGQAGPLPKTGRPPRIPVGHPKPAGRTPPWAQHGGVVREGSWELFWGCGARQWFTWHCMEPALSGGDGVHPHMTAPWCCSSGVSSPLWLPQNNVPFRWHVPPHHRDIRVAAGHRLALKQSLLGLFAFQSSGNELRKQKGNKNNGVKPACCGRLSCGSAHCCVSSGN